MSKFICFRPQKRLSVVSFLLFPFFDYLFLLGRSLPCILCAEKYSQRFSRFFPSPLTVLLRFLWLMGLDIWEPHRVATFPFQNVQCFLTSSPWPSWNPIVPANSIVPLTHSILNHTPSFIVPSSLFLFYLFSLSWHYQRAVTSMPNTIDLISDSARTVGNRRMTQRK